MNKFPVEGLILIRDLDRWFLWEKTRIRLEVERNERAMCRKENSQWSKGSCIDTGSRFTLKG